MSILHPDNAKVVGPKPSPPDGGACYANPNCPPHSSDKCNKYTTYDDCLNDSKKCCEWLWPPQPSPSPPSGIRGWNCKDGKCALSQPGEDIKYNTLTDCQADCYPPLLVPTGYKCAIPLGGDGKYSCIEVPHHFADYSTKEECQSHCKPHKNNESDSYKALNILLIVFAATLLISIIFLAVIYGKGNKTSLESDNSYKV